MQSSVNRMESLAIELPDQAIAAFCKKWKIRELAIFGSAVREDFGPDSDVDVLVRFADDARWSLWDVIGAEDELAQILSRPVDLLERGTVEQSENWIRRDSILNSARVVYGQ
jgi:predicted nucleotidyltransferase